jgi:hypothetical protein
LNYNFGFAEGSNDATSQNANPSANATSNDIVTDFSKGASGFHLDNTWKIQDGEFQFIPNETTKSRFYWNLFQDRSATNYKVSVNTRWINGSNYSSFGLIFGYTYESYYIYLINLSSYLMLLKNDNGRWKKIKEVKNPSISESYDNLEVVHQNPMIQCYINGKKIFEIKDKNRSNTGFVGICSDGDVQCGFKDFHLKQL